MSEINQHIPYDFVQKYVDEIYQHSTSSLFSENKRIFDLVRQGKDYGRYKVNFLHPERDQNCFTYLVDFPLQSPEHQHTFSLDLILFVNYLPFIVVINRENKSKFI